MHGDCQVQATTKLTCSGFSPGGTQAYSSKAQPESSSDVELRWKSNISLVTVFSISSGITVSKCSDCGHLQCRQIFLREKENQETKMIPSCLSNTVGEIFCISTDRITLGQSYLAQHKAVLIYNCAWEIMSLFCPR